MELFLVLSQGDNESSPIDSALERCVLSATYPRKELDCMYDFCVTSKYTNVISFISYIISKSRRK